MAADVKNNLFFFFCVCVCVCVLVIKIMSCSCIPIGVISDNEQEEPLNISECLTSTPIKVIVVSLKIRRLS